ncbi:AAA family ATPase [Ancylobacter rudongensis]|uniref:AAA domain-containing protein n=1 Tax=Ancylobacter rudongensis TaxID=177413 RepID=A0A1G4RHM5_9HYPH|nr:AAA family ATPase [Ancylobacter rudongensis]SCW56266.1 AAA domain-containing protein [Ancylobacter rudongensis]
MTDFPDLMAAVAGRLLGEPNRAMSSKDELRFGTHGSLSVKVGGPHKGTWADHEAGEGGGVLDLIARLQGGGREGALSWLKQTFPDFAGRPEAPSTGRRIVATYPYVDEAGALLFEVVRYEPKEFRQRRPDGAGGFAWNLQGVRPVPYHLPELIEAIGSERTVFIVEGEKDVDRLRTLNVPATCNAGGAGKWKLDFVEHFVGADVVIVPDNDDPGREHAEKVARALQPVATRVRVLTLPNLPRKGDVSDWLQAGGTVEELHRLTEAAPDWRPAAATRLPAVWWGDEDKQPPLSWLVKGLLIEGGFSTVYGPPGTSKSFLVLDLALHVAHGRDWFGKRVAAGGVVYVSGEGGAGMLMRMKAWRQEKDGEAGKPFVLVPSSVNLYDDEEGVETLIADVKDHQARMSAPLRLVVLDTLSRMIGSGDEDKARDINVVVQKAERIQRELGCHVLVVHHSGKDTDRGARGSNALLGAVDAAIEITRHETGVCAGKIAKVKDGGDIAPFKYELLQSVLGTDEDGDDITSCIIAPTDASTGESKGTTRLPDAARIALEALKAALVEQGQPSPGGQIPNGVKIVSVEVWREYAYRRGLGDTQEAKKKAFQRARETLSSKGEVAMWEPWAWLIR